MAHSSFPPCLSVIFLSKSEKPGSQHPLSICSMCSIPLYVRSSFRIVNSYPRVMTHIVIFLFLFCSFPLVIYLTPPKGRDLIQSSVNSDYQESQDLLQTTQDKGSHLTSLETIILSHLRWLLASVYSDLVVYLILCPEIVCILLCMTTHILRHCVS